MSFFLFMKQFVDMLYPYQFLDYGMVVLVILLLGYQVALVRPDIRHHISVTDGIMLGLGVLLTFSWFRSVGGYQIYFKVLSALLLYFVGRIYYDRIKECYGSLVLAAYLIIYLNFARRIWNFGFHLWQVKDAGGDFYYNDTDMAFAMILAMVFVAMYARNSVFKLLTMFIVCPYMVFYSDAGIQMVLMLAVYAVIGIYILELILRNQRFSGILLTIMVIGLLGVVVLLYAPVTGLVQNSVAGVFESRFLDFGNMYSRYGEWNRILQRCAEGSLLQHIFGINLGSHLVIQSMYIKIFYATGYCGLLLALLAIISVLYYVVNIEDRKTFYLAVIMAILLLGSGVAVNSMESTQMSWFPMLFAGMVISSVQAQRGALVGVVTGTIRPSANMGQLILRDEKERLSQYIQGVRALVESEAFHKIVFAENSGYGCEAFDALQSVATEHQVELECLSFYGDVEQCCVHGKGYGEGEIMEYVFEHSQLLKNEPYFVKITGRLQLDNIAALSTSLRKSRTYFNIPNRTKRDIYDTRIYAMPTKQFEQCFLKEYGQVMDEEGIYLEHVYTRILKENHIKVYNFPRYPRIRGISGSGGAIYDYTEWKCKIKDLLSKVNYYKVKES